MDHSVIYERYGMSAAVNRIRCGYGIKSNAAAIIKNLMKVWRISDIIFMKVMGKERFERWYGRCLHGKHKCLNLCPK